MPRLRANFDKDRGTRLVSYAPSRSHSCVELPGAGQGTDKNRLRRDEAEIEENRQKVLRFLSLPREPEGQEDPDPPRLGFAFLPADVGTPEVEP